MEGVLQIRAGMMLTAANLMFCFSWYSGKKCILLFHAGMPAPIASLGGGTFLKY